MAIYHCSVKIIGRGSGRSAVGAAAYRSGEDIINQWDGTRHDYTKKTGIIKGASFILAPEHAPGWATNRERLWNEVEKIEKQINAQLAREFELALPNELNRKQQQELVREFCKSELVMRGMAVDVNFHDKNSKIRNSHVHIMTTTRPFTEEGRWGAKSKKEYIRDKNGERIKLKSGQWKSRKVRTTDWDSHETLEHIRSSWADHVNKSLERAGQKGRVNHRSYANRGIEQVPSVHLGPEAHAIEKKQNRKGQQMSTERGNRNREIVATNNEIKSITAEIDKLEYAVDFFEKAERMAQSPYEPQMQHEPYASTAKSETPFTEPSTPVQTKTETKPHPKVENQKSKNRSKKSALEWKLICRTRDKHCESLLSIIRDAQRDIENEILQHQKNHIHEASVAYFEEKYRDRFTENDNAIKNYNIDLIVYKKAKTLEKLRLYKELNSRYKTNENRRKELKASFNRDVESAAKGIYQPGDNKAAQQILRLTQTITREKSAPQIKARLIVLDSANDMLNTQLSKVTMEQRRYRNFGNILSEANPNQQMALPKVEAGGGGSPMAKARSELSKLLPNLESKISALDTKVEDIPEIDWGMLTTEQAIEKSKELSRAQSL